MRVTLYSKPDCALCDEVKRDLLEIQRSATFTLEIRNILEEPDAFARFRYLIPVVDVEGGPLLTPPLDRPTLESVLGEAHRAQDGSGTSGTGND